METEEYAIMAMLQRTNWWYRGRRFVVRALFGKCMPTGNRVLDLGCGAGEGRSIVDGTTRLAGLDISNEALVLAKHKGYVSLHRGSGDRLPFPEHSFDGILMLDVLEHIGDDRATLRECHRVLAASGVLFLTVPAYPWLWSGHDELYGHKRRYTLAALMEIVEHAGFTVIVRSHFVMTLLPVIAAFRLCERAVRNARRSHFFPIPRMLNAALYVVLFCEGTLIRFGCRLPFGSTIVLVAQKDSE